MDDILDHYENHRADLLTGKAMIVAYSRAIAMKIYNRILKLRPSWTEKVAVVMTESNKDPEEWRSVIGNKRHRDELAKKFKDNDSPLKIAIVVDMWLTGFDVPSLATMYVYKPMKGYNLMQAIARVNRVFGDKEGGLVVDYVGIAAALKEAMNDYTSRDKKNYGDTDIAKVAYPKFLEKLSICRDLFHGYDYSMFTTGTDLQRSKAISGAVNFIVGVDKKREREDFLKEALLMRQAFYRFCQIAANHPEQDYFFIIDEINRGNLSKIFGELLMLIDKDYRGTQITLSYSGMKFFVPDNLYIIGMMNTADRSLAMIDYALRRRFSFFEMEPGFSSEGFIKYQESLNSETFNELISHIKQLNKEILEDKALGKGFQIGHSYFCGREVLGCTDEWLRSVVEFDIIPTLSEYWFDEPKKLSFWENNLRGVFDD